MTSRYGWIRRTIEKERSYTFYGKGRKWIGILKLGKTWSRTSSPTSGSVNYWPLVDFELVIRQDFGYDTPDLTKPRLTSAEILPMKQNIRIQIDRIREVIVQKLTNKGLISLYLGGTVPSEDRIQSSDIDTLGIVEWDFDFTEEEKVNCYLRGCLKEEIGINSTFRGITLSELNGGKQKGIITKWVPIRILIKRLPFRHRGIAKQLVSHVTYDGYKRKYRSIIINADPEGTPINIWRRLGFRDELLKRWRYQFQKKNV